MSREEGFVLHWLSRADVSLLGECKGKALDALVSAGLAKVGKPPPGKDADYSPVWLTGKGILKLKEVQP